MTHRLGILSLPGSTMYEMAVPWEVFGTDRRDLSADWYQACFVDGGGGDSGAFALEAAEPLSCVGGLDTLVVPPTRPVDGPYPQRVLDAIIAAHATGARIVSLCTGAFVLAEAGLLDGRAATTHWMYSAQFRARFPQVRLTPDVLYVDNGDVLTSAGKSAAMDLCLYLVAKDFGTGVSNEIARRLVIPPHRIGNQAQFMNRTAVHGDLPKSLIELTEWIGGELREGVSVEGLAEHMHLSTRQLSRMFKAHFQISPRQWLEQQRIFAAQRYLESTDHTASWIAHEAGFGSYASLRRSFHRNVGMPPEAYRSAFRSSAAT